MRAYLRVLERPAFRNLWLAQTTSVVGDRLVIVALALFVTDLTGSATDVGLVLGAQTLPFVVFLLIGGVWADRLPRARLMVATDVVRAALHVLLAALIFTDVVEIWHLVVIEALFGTAEAFFRPAYTGLLPRTIPEPEIQEAQALSNMTNNLAELTGPALATALVLGVGAGWAFLFDALTFVMSAFFLTRVRVRRGATTRRGTADSGGGAGGGLSARPVAHVAVGHRGRLRTRRAARQCAAVRARTDRRRGQLQLGRGVRDRDHPDRRGRRGRRARGPTLATASSDARGDAGARGVACAS